MSRLLFVFLLLVWLPPAFGQNSVLDYHLHARALAPGVYVVEGAIADFSPANGCNIINNGFIVTEVGVVGDQYRALTALR